MPAPPQTPNAAPQPDPDTRPPVLLGGLVRALDRGLARLTTALGRSLPDDLNPLARLGAIANFMLVAACITGALLLFWYVPSHDSAHASVQAMAESPFLAGLLRSLHRYSSDAAMLAILVHGLAMLVQRRLAGPRWVAWVTGIVGVGLVWFIGWLGYWLVWDTRAQLVAKGTAKGLDVLPIFVDPISSSFLTDAGVPSLLFFVVFFLHILLPLLLVIALWLHLARLSRAVWLPRRGLALVSLGAILVVSVAFPAESSDAAAMASHPEGLSGDWWYLLPVMLTDRLSGGMLWAVALGVGIVTIAMPWWFVRRRAQRPDLRSEKTQEATRLAASEPGTPVPHARTDIASVETSKCNACETCAKDCPFDAIAMMPRTDGRRFPSVAVVDPARCVGCGVCSGSCDSSAITLPWLPQPAVRSRVDGWLARIEEKPAPGAIAAEEPCRKASADAIGALPAHDAEDHDGDHPTQDAHGETLVVYGCSRSAAGRLPHDRVTGAVDALPDTRLITLPCAGWLHPMTVERTLRRGAAGVVVASCSPANCTSREGARWTRDRLEGRREPELRPERIDTRRLLHLEVDGHEGARLVGALTSFRASLGDDATTPTAPATAKPTAPARRRPRALAVLGVGLVLAAATWLPSDLPLPTRGSPGPELVVAFKLPGSTTEACRLLTADELAALPPHKRTPKVCERSRSGVRLVVEVDGERLSDRVYEAGGAFEDGAARGLERFIVAPGPRRVVVSLGDDRGDDRSDGGGALRHRVEATRTFSRERSNVLIFDAAKGFAWH